MEDNADKVRKLIKHEENVLVSRIQWLSAIQGLLMAALAFAWNARASAILYALCCLGIWVALSTGYATRTAVRTMSEQIQWWDKTRPKEYSGPDVIGFRPDRWKFPFLRPSFALPIGFILFWAVSLLALLSRSIVG